MAYTDEELYTYFDGVEDGSVMDTTQPIEDIRDTTYEDRASTMEFAEEYRTEPSEAMLSSERLEGLLASDSPYIQRARTKATEAAGSRGLLDSSMAAGAAEGAAIDRGLQVAKADTEVDMFNVGAQTESQKLRYQAAQNIGGTTQDALNRLGAEQAGHVFRTVEEEQAFEHEKILADDKIAADFEADALKYTSERVLKGIEANTALTQSYLDGYAQIATMPSRENKDAMLASFFDQITWGIENNEIYKDIKITGEGVPQFDIESPELDLGREITTPTTLEEAEILAEEAGTTVPPTLDLSNSLDVQDWLAYLSFND